MLQEVSHSDVLSAMRGASADGGESADDEPTETRQPPQKAGLWDWLTGAVDPVGRPHFPTMVRIAAMSPAPVTTSSASSGGQGPLYQVTIEVETEPSEADALLAPRPPATHYVLATSVVRTVSNAEPESAAEEFRHHCTSTVPFARSASFAVTGLAPGTLYEFDVCAANDTGSSQGVQVHVLTPSPASGSAASASASTAADVQEAAAAALSPSQEQQEKAPEEEECFFDADEQDADVRSGQPPEARGALQEQPPRDEAASSRSHLSAEVRRTLEEQALHEPAAGCRSLLSDAVRRTLEEQLLLDEAECGWEECVDADAGAAEAGRPPTPSRRRPERSQDVARQSQPGTADAAGGPQAPLFLGFVWASGFQVSERQLTLGNVEPRDVEQAVEKLQALCTSPVQIKPQQALRLALGMSIDVGAAEVKWRQIRAWRREFRMEEERARAREMHSNRSVPVSFPHHDEVCKKLLMVNPCSLVTTNGYPVSIWHIGTLSVESATAVPLEHVNAWSRSYFEYLDVWLTEESDRTSRLLGHIHVFDLEGLSWWHLVSGDLLERGRAALHAGEFYVENCYDVYAINASTLFNTVWRLLQRFLSARAAAKIVVDSGVPNELLTALGPMAWERLQNVLQAPKSKVQAPILRPPRRGGRAALL